MATALQPTFALQQTEDSMEISSEYGNMDADIDIDLDAPDHPDTNMQSFLQDDQQMHDDLKSDRMDDDLMIDDSNLDDTDRMMQDDAPPPLEQDEELLDFSEDEEDVPMNPVEPPQPDIQLDQPQQLTTLEEPVEHVQSEVASELLNEGVQPIDSEAPHIEVAQSQPQPDAQDPTDQPVTGENSVNVAQELSNQDASSEPQPHAQETQSIPTVDHAEQIESSAQESVLESTEFPNAANQTLEENERVAHQDTTDEPHQTQQGNDDNETGATEEDDHQSFQPTLTRQETDLSNYTVPEDHSRERQANSPTVTGLHPTIVEYQGNEVYLFPSRDPAVPEQYLLQNENLVTTSLGDLLQACRTALGDGISEEEELVLGVEELDLYVSEDSTPAFSTSFSELLDMYLQLHKLDGNDNPPPFRVSLTTKTRFSNRLASITQAISEGKGFSQLSFLQYYEYDEPTELPDEDFDDDFDEFAEPDDESQHLIEENAANDDESQHLIEENAAHNESAQTATELEQNAQDLPSPKAEEQQVEPSQAAEGHGGEYEGETAGQDDAPIKTIDQSEYNPEETQHFDAQGDESEVVDENHAGPDENTAEFQSITGNAEVVVEGESHHQHQSSDDAVQHEHASGQEENLEQQEYENQDEENLFGQGEFFDEENYEYQDGEVPQDGEDAFAGEQVVNNDDHYQESEEYEAPIAEAQHGPVAAPEDYVQVDAAEQDHDDTKDAEQCHEDVEESVDATARDAENYSAATDIVVSKDIVTRRSPAVEDDDYDEINFDDEDGYEDEGAGLAPVLTNASSKTSPGGKRSFSELDDVDDEQDSKKARGS